MHLCRSLALALLVLACPSAALESSQGRLKVEAMADGLEEPWGLAFLPDGGFLVTERAGRLWRFDAAGHGQRISGVPSVLARGQGGLLDVMVPADFGASREVYLTFAKRQRGGGGTALGRGRLSGDNRRLEGFETVFEMSAGSRGGRHFGSRIVEGPERTLYVTIGDRGDRESAQDLARHNGSVLRLDRDGRPAPGNPFAGVAGARPEIWSLGHRNAQGAALDLDGNLVVAEHGARGGDEVNRIRRGRNYGWPVIAYGRHYSGARIGIGTHSEGMEQPAHYWDPSMAPSGLMIYSGRLWPAWKGDLFVGSLKFDHISRLEGTGDMRELEQLQSRHTGRVRDVREAPDGSIWFLSVDAGAVFRLTPE